MTKNEVVPLGGISKKNYKILKLLDCEKISGISYLNKKGPIKKWGL